MSAADWLRMASDLRAVRDDNAASVQIRRNGVTLPYAMTAGQILPFRGARILATGTSGTFYGWD